MARNERIQPATRLIPQGRVRAGIERLLAASVERDCDIAVMEVANGLYQRETAALVADPWFRDRISGLVFACGDAVAGSAGWWNWPAKGSGPMR
ncbi:hypothetical protein [Rhodovulum euryhalinum]|uniref:hypothetical protein n=1 Tax=Rhodovulum euryhalinum TaxID=35805 RepID=UPI0010512D8E|nr:hypothetical protein [Rhodovulum euryhalinum]